MTMYARRQMRAAMLEHSVMVENVSEDEYNRLIGFIKENVPTTDRSTPQWKPPALDEDRPTKLVFRFRDESQAMAFKLII